MSKKIKDNLTKAKLIYSGEIAIFAVIFLLIGILILTGVIEIKEWKRIAFSYVTLVGGAWIIADFIWTLSSKKRRAKKPLIDKIVVLPAGLMVVVFDIYAFANGMVHTDVTSILFSYIIGADLCYLSLVYVFEAIYHWKHPLPEILEAALEADEEDKKKAVKENDEGVDKEDAGENDC